MVRISYCDYLILPNSVELPMLKTANIQHSTASHWFHDFLLPKQSFHGQSILLPYVVQIPDFSGNQVNAEGHPSRLLFFIKS